jgi:hypothetical protein
MGKADGQLTIAELRSLCRGPYEIPYLTQTFAGVIDVHQTPQFDTCGRSYVSAAKSERVSVAWWGGFKLWLKRQSATLLGQGRPV